MYDNFTPLTPPGTIVSPLQVANAAVETKNLRNLNLRSAPKIESPIMESESDVSESNLLAVKEMVLDEDKIITYISLSKDLCVHVNISKMLLHQVVQNIRKEKPKLEINVNYLVSGLLTDNKARMTVCSELDLMELKKKFKIVYFEHIYSISKGSTGGNNTIYILVNNFNDYSLCLGSIKNTACIKHTANEIDNLKSTTSKVSEIPISKPSDTYNKKIKTEGTKLVSTGSNSHHLEEDIIEPINNDIKLQHLLKVKKEETSAKKEIIPTLKQNNQKVNGSKTQKGIAGFFNKASLVSTNKNVSEKKNGHGPEIRDNNIIVDENESNTLSKIKSNTKTNSASENDKALKKEPNDENNKSNLNCKNKMLTRIRKSSKVDKKRKRVLHVSDSESEIESENEKELPSISPDSDDEIPPTPMTNNIKITSGLVNPKKKRKIIDKTYQDDEGYILTKKVEVYESCSEEENTNDNVTETKVVGIIKELSPKNNIKQKNTKKKLPSPAKGKQATLTNFFKRK